MTEPLQPDEEAEAIIERYRRASAADLSRPSEATRAAILAHARAVAAAQRAKEKPAFDTTRSAANDRYWWRTAVAGVAIAGLALMIWAPRYQTDGVAARNAARVGATPPSASAPSAPASAAESAERMAGAPSNTRENVPADSIDAPASGARMMARVPTRPQIASPPPVTAAAAANDGDRAGSAGPAIPEPAVRKAEAASNSYAAPPAVEPVPAKQTANVQRSDQLNEIIVTGGRATDRAVQSSNAKAAPSREALAPAASLTAGIGPGSALRAAASAGDAARARALLAGGAPLEDRDAAGRTPLLLAVIDNQSELVRVLLDAGANVNALDAAGQSALALARGAGHADLVALLEARGAR